MEVACKVRLHASKCLKVSMPHWSNTDWYRHQTDFNKYGFITNHDQSEKSLNPHGVGVISGTIGAIAAESGH